MTFVKRSDGITYNVGGHYASRGTLEQVKYGGVPDGEPMEDWMSDVIASFMPLEDSVLMKEASYLDDEILYLWGIYSDNCPHIRRKTFDDEYFCPGY